MNHSGQPLDVKDVENLEYLAEGGANIIFRPPQALHKQLYPRQAPQENGKIQRPLLRLRKDLPHLPAVADQARHFEEEIKPLFPLQHLIPQQLIKLPQGLISALNERLANDERAGKRPAKRHGVYIAIDEPHGLLLEDMSTRGSEVLIELKPKWLSQSPNAPVDSIRCRTCALRAMRKLTGNARLSEDSRTRDARGLCPLALVSDNEAVLDDVANALVAPDAVQDVRRSLRAFLAETTVLPRLRELQMQLDPGGILGIREGEKLSEAFLVATTLRDCTLYVRLDVQGGSAEGRLGDLDIKLAEPGKIVQWRETEQLLHSGGWYDGRKDVVTGCILE